MEKSIPQSGHGPHFQPKLSSNLGSSWCFLNTVQDWTFHETGLGFVAWTYSQPFLPYNYTTSSHPTWKMETTSSTLRFDNLSWVVATFPGEHTLRPSSESSECLPCFLSPQGKCVCVCVCVCMCVCMCVGVLVCVLVGVCGCGWVWVLVSVCVGLCGCVWVCTWVCMWVYVEVCEVGVGVGGLGRWDEGKDSILLQLCSQNSGLWSLHTQAHGHFKPRRQGETLFSALCSVTYFSRSKEPRIAQLFRKY